MEDSQIDAIHQDFKKEKESQNTIVNKLPGNIKIGLMITIGVTLWYFGYTHNEWVKALVIVAVLLSAVYMWATSNTNAVEGELTDLQLRTLLWKQLRYYQLNPFGTHYVIPDGKIQIMPAVSRWTVGDTVKYRTYGVCIIKRNSLHDYYSIDVNIFTGDIVKIAEGYFTGKEKPHVKYIESEDVMKKKRYDEAVDVRK